MHHRFASEKKDCVAFFLPLEYFPDDSFIRLERPRADGEAGPNGTSVGDHAMTAPDFFNELQLLWGIEHVIEKLLDCSWNCSGMKESHWLELKATLCQPSERFLHEHEATELYRDEWRKGFPKDVSGDHCINVAKAVCAMMNNPSGGIVVIGVDDKKGRLADFDSICESEKCFPVFDEDEFKWDSDKWRLWTEQRCKIEWKDRLGCIWKFVPSLDRSNLVEWKVAHFRGRPVMAILVRPSPEPAYLAQTCCPALPRKYKEWKNDAEKAGNRRLWCRCPHDEPGTNGSPFPECRHVMRREVANNVEWDIGALALGWTTRKEKDKDPEYFQRELQAQKVYRNAFSLNGDIGAAKTFCALRDIQRAGLKMSLELLSGAPHVFLTENHAPKKNVRSGVTVLSTPDVPGDSGRPGFAAASARDAGAKMLGILSMSRMAEGPLPLFLDFRKFDDEHVEMLKDKTGSFLERSVSWTYGANRISSDLWRHIDGCFDTVLFVFGGRSRIRDSEVLSLWSQAVCCYLSRKSASSRNTRIVLVDAARPENGDIPVDDMVPGELEDFFLDSSD